MEGQWDTDDNYIILENKRWGGHGLSTTVQNGTARLLAQRLHASTVALLEEAALPAQLSEQLLEDACSIGLSVGRMCSFARDLEVKLEIFGESTCSRWHQDSYAGRAIVSYTGITATEFVDHDDVDFYAMRNGGTNTDIIRPGCDVGHVDVGDILFMKGRHFPEGASGLVHKSPKIRYHPDGRVVRRLVLKIDVPPN